MANYSLPPEGTTSALGSGKEQIHQVLASMEQEMRKWNNDVQGVVANMITQEGLWKKMDGATNLDGEVAAIVKTAKAKLQDSRAKAQVLSDSLTQASAAICMFLKTMGQKNNLQSASHSSEKSDHVPAPTNTIPTSNVGPKLINLIDFEPTEGGSGLEVNTVPTSNTPPSNSYIRDLLHLDEIVWVEKHCSEDGND